MIYIAINSVSLSLAEPYRFGPYNAESDAEQTSQTVTSKTGTGASIRKSFTNPLMGQGALTTFDDSQQFNAKFACHNSQPIAELLVIPATTGDIATFNLQQDTDLDGHFDTLYTPPAIISGICTNGILSCTPGTWNDCRSFQWAAEAHNAAVLIPTALSNLGGCYCINNSCGNNLLFTNLADTLGDLAGGAIGSVLTQTPTLAISNIKVDGLAITYHGQDAANCGAQGSLGQEALYQNPENMTATAAANAPLSSMFQSLTTGALAADTGFVKRTCSITRNVSIDEAIASDIILYNGGAGSMKPCGPGCVELILGTKGDNYWSGTCGLFKHDVSFWVEKPDRILSATLVRALFDDHIQVSVNNQLIYAHDAGWTDLSLNSYPPGTVWGGSTPFCERKQSWDEDPYQNFTSLIQSKGSHNFEIRVAVAGEGEGYTYVQIQVDEQCYVEPDQITNSCQLFESDTQCQLEQETVDTVETVRHFNPTGLSPLGEIKEIAGNYCTQSVYRQWWHKERTYHCQTEQNFDLDNTVQRAAVIQESASLDGYDDYRLDGEYGWVLGEDLTLSLPNLPNIQHCTPTCKIKTTEEANDVAGLGTTESFRTVDLTPKYKILECDREGRCPAPQDSVVMSPCGCLNDFSEATAKMQAARLAGKDMLCTSGTPSPL